MSVSRKTIVLSAVHHQGTPLCPYTFVLNPLVDGTEVEQRLTRHYGNEAWRTRYHNYIEVCAQASDGKLGPTTGGIRRDVYGSLWRMDLRPFHLQEPALKEPSLRGYRLPSTDLLFPGEWEETTRAALARHADAFCVGAIGFGLFERSWALRGFSETLMDSVGEPAFFSDLLETLCEHQLRLVDRILAMPVDGVWFSDDWGSQGGVILGPDRWREVLKPRVARLYGRVKAAGKVVLHHTCGSVVDIIPDLIEIGLDVLESVQPEARGMNPYELKKRFGERLTFWGGLGSQSIIPFGKPEELRREIRNLARNMTTGGGYILSCSKPLQPETPAANAAAVLEEFIAHGEGSLS